MSDTGVLDSDLKRHSAWHSRDFEAQMLVEVLRLSRLTVLYGAEGAGKTTLLKTGVLPLLRLRADVRRSQDETGAIAPSPDRQSENRATDRGSDIAIIFDRWEGAPITALRSQIRDALRGNAPQMAEPPPELADSLTAWSKALGVRFFIILDGFEQYLRAPSDCAGVADFDDELVRIINAPGLAIHLLLSIRDDAEPLLSRFRGRICGLEDAFLRLPRMQPVASPSLQSPEPDGPTTAATPPTSSETPSMRPNEPSKPPALPAASAAESAPVAFASVADCSGPPQLNEAKQSAIDDRPVNALKPMRGLLGRGGSEPTIHDRVQLYKNTQRASNLFVSKARGAATRARSPRRRHALRRSARRFIRISLAAVAAGLVIGVGAGYFTVSQNHPVWQAASSPSSSVVVTVPAADPSSAPVIPTVPADPPEPSPLQERISTVHSPISRPGSPTPIKNAKGTSATREASARMAAPEAVSVTSAAVGDWQTEMRRELDACRHEGFFARVMCTESVRWKRCAPDRWNRIPECATGSVQWTSSD